MSLTPAPATGVRAGDEVIYTDRCAVTWSGTATTGVRGSGPAATVWVLTGAQIHELPAHRVRVRGHRIDTASTPAHLLRQEVAA